jgi:hypothetical protein
MRRLPLTDRLEQKGDSLVYADCGPIGRVMPDCIDFPEVWTDQPSARGHFAVRAARDHVDRCTKMRHVQAGHEKGASATLAAYNDGRTRVHTAECDAIVQEARSCSQPATGVRMRRPSTEDFPMLDSKQLDELAQRLASAMPKGIQMLQEDINRNLRASLEAGLARLDLVTREEFDVQSAVLARSREKLAALEARIAELEQALAVKRTPVD